MEEFIIFIYKIFGRTMVVMDKERKLKSQLRKQKKLIKTLKKMIRNYAPYMEFPDE